MRTGTFWCSRRSWRLRAMLRLHSANLSTNCYRDIQRYVAWARAHNAPEDSQAEMALYWLWRTKFIWYLVIQEGFHCSAKPSSHLTSMSSGQGPDGLTRAHDKDSIPLIVEACKRFHGEEVRLIAHTLRQFMRDPDARAAAQAGEEQCVPPPAPIEALKRNDGTRCLRWASRGDTSGRDCCHPEAKLCEYPG